MQKVNWNKLLALNFGTQTISRGRDYWQMGRVRSFAWQPDEEAQTLRSKVIGTGGSYDQETYVDFKFEEIDGDCTCPVGYNCKHVVAALLAASHKTIEPDAGDFAPPIPTTIGASGELFAFTGKPEPPSIAPPPWRAPTSKPLPISIERWLTQVATAQTSQDDASPAENVQRIIYIFEPSRLQGEQGGSVNIHTARTTKSGGYSGISKYRDTGAYFNPPRYILPSDVRILQQLSAITGRGYSFEFPMVNIDVALVRTIIATGRAFWLDIKRTALQWAQPRAAVVEWTTLDTGGRQPGLRTTPPAETIASLPPIYIDAASNECGMIDSALVDAVAAAIVAAPALPAEWVERVSRELQTRKLDASIPLPTRLEEEFRQDFRPQPILTLKSHQLKRYDPRSWKYIVQHLETAALMFDYLGVRVTGKNPPEITRVDGNRLLRIARNTAFERAARARLTSAGLQATESVVTQNITRELQGTLTVADATNDTKAYSVWTTFLETMVPVLRSEGWKIDVAADFRFDIAPITEWYADVDESSNQWFDLEIGIEVEGSRISLIPILVKLIHTSPSEWRPAALEAMDDETKIIVPLGDGRRAALPLTRLKPLLATLFELYLREPTGTRVRLTPLDAARLAEMERALALRWLGGERMRQLGARLARFDGVLPVPVPPTFLASLRPYQQEGLAWLQFLREYGLAGVLADDMGLGKTVQTLAHLATEKEAGRLDLPALVVAPTSMMSTWQTEAARFAPGLKVLVSHGLMRHDRGEAFADFDLVLTTYALVVRDEDKLLAQPWYLAILDEAQNIKNPKTKAANIACRLQAKLRLCLTGTPMENHLGELWSLFRFLMPGLLGDEQAFKRDYRVPIEREGDLARQKFLARRLHPFMLRRTKDLVAHELPAKTLVTRTVEFESAQADLYETVRAAMDKRVRDEIAAKGIAKSHIVVLDALLKLRQICCDPRLLKTDLKVKSPSSAKLSMLMEMLDELLAEGRSILLFSQFTSMLTLIEVELEKRSVSYAKLTGSTRDRKKPIEQFQSGEVKLFLISLKAGGTGLTLTAADTVIHYDPWWNPAVENQATDRAHRIGQVKPVFVYKLIAKGTLEERIIELQAKKGALAAGLLDNESKTSNVLNAKDLQALFEPMQA